MEAPRFLPESEPQTPEITVVKKIVEGEEDVYHFSVDNQLIEITMTRERLLHDRENTYHIFFGRDEKRIKIGEVDVYDWGAITCVDRSEADEHEDPAEHLKSQNLLQASMGLLKEAIYLDFPEAWVIEDEFGNLL
jgi:hypothetical protein